MKIDLHTLYTQVRDCTTLPASRDALLDGLLAMLESDEGDGGHVVIAKSLRALTPHPDDSNRQISWAALLGEALTRNTSHVAVDPRHPGYAHAHRMLTETPELDKAAHIADLEARLHAKTAEHAALKAEVDADRQSKSEEARRKMRELAGDSLKTRQSE